MGIPLGELVNDPQRLLSGDKFRQAGVYNVIESGFFDWILLAKGGQKYLSRTVQRIQTFNWENVDHDVLKILYESVINPAVRKKMGEYYTPDWLAEGITAQVVTKPLEQSILDVFPGVWIREFRCLRVDARRRTTTHRVPPRYFSGYPKTRPGLFLTGSFRFRAGC